MTNQEIFDKVSTHLLTQGCKSENAGRCLYRGPNGMKCAIGCVIPDDKYDSIFEGRSAEDKILIDLFTHLGFTFIQMCLLSKLQEIHDSKQPKDWKLQLKDLADAYNFQWNHEGGNV